jgi:uncharacterized protein YraI
MMKLPNIAKAAGLGVAAIMLTAGVASAAVATASVNVRTGPSTGFRAIDTLRPGEQVAIVDRDGSWCAVQKSGPDGWVACRYLSDSVRYRDYDDDEPRISLSFGVGVRPDRPRRPPQHWWYDDYDDGYWYRDRGPRNSFNLSFGG